MNKAYHEHIPIRVAYIIDRLNDQNQAIDGYWIIKCRSCGEFLGYKRKGKLTWTPMHSKST